MNCTHHTLPCASSVSLGTRMGQESMLKVGQGWGCGGAGAGGLDCCLDGAGLAVFAGVRIVGRLPTARPRGTLKTGGFVARLAGWGEAAAAALPAPGTLGMPAPIACLLGTGAVVGGVVASSFEVCPVLTCCWTSASIRVAFFCWSRSIFSTFMSGTGGGTSPCEVPQSGADGRPPLP